MFGFIAPLWDVNANSLRQAATPLFGFIAPLWDVNANSLRQAATPPRLLGRVSAASTFLGVGTAPIGALMVGWLGHAFGSRVALIEAAVVTVLAVLVLVWSPVPRLRDPASVTAPSGASIGG
jgi:hypothetical protein